MEKLKTVLRTLLYLCMVWYPVPVFGQTGTQAKALYTQLFVTDSYNPRIRPANDQSQATAVTIDFNLVAINEVNTVQGTLKTTGFLKIEWTDDFLQWTPSSYGNLTGAHWPQNEVWKPDISLANSFADIEELGSQYHIIWNKYNGTIGWSPFEVFVSTCSVDVTQFPFDKQTCKLKFLSRGYGKSEVSLTGGAEGFTLDDYEPHPEWSILSRKVSLTLDTDDDIVVFEVTIKRNPEYVMLTVMLPLLILSILNLFTFAVPCDSGERVSFAVTVFLTFAVFFTLISSILPESVAIITVYLILMTTSSTLICIISILEVRLYNFDESVKKVPSWFVFISKIGSCKVCSGGKDQSHNKVDNFENGGEGKETKLKSFVNEDVDTASVTKKPCRPETEVAQWKDVINGTDWFLLYFFAFYFVLCTIICLCLEMA